MYNHNMAPLTVCCCDECNATN